MNAADRLGEELTGVPGITIAGQSANSKQWLRAAWRESEQAEAAATRDAENTCAPADEPQGAPDA